MQSIRSGNLEFRLNGDGSLELFDLELGERLLRMPSARMLAPDFARDAAVEVSEASPAELRLSLRSSALAAGEIAIARRQEGFSLASSFVPAADVEMNALDIIPSGAATTCYHAHLFRHRHYTAKPWPEILLGAEFEVDTYSRDWQYAPHPSAFLLTRGASHLFFGATCAPVGGFGVYIKGAANSFATCHLDYGSKGWGMRLKAGERWEAPEFRVFLDHGGDVYATYAEFGRILAAEGRIPDPAAREVVPWHREHVYCTWNDQSMLESTVSDAAVAARSEGRSDVFRKVAVALDEKMVREAASIILRERLPIRTILLDDGWSYNTTDYRADPRAFPNMRGLVDDLHSMGFKVAVWWTWGEVRGADGERAIGPGHCILGGKRNRHGCIIGDFSRESTREEYLRPMFRRFFGKDPDCYDFDGIKTDFQADKVHCDMPPDDPAWRGEENYFARLYGFIFGEMRRHKPDAMHIGCAGNYFLAQYIDTNRTFDVFTDDVLVHANHARMLRATAPGTLPAFDLHGCRTRLREYLRTAREMGCPVHYGSLYMLHDDMLSPPSPMAPADFDLLRKEM